MVLVGLVVIVGPFVGLLVFLGAVSDDATGSSGSSGSVSGDSAEITTTTLPAPAAVHDCVQIGSSGDVMGTASCAEGGAPYRVVEAFNVMDGPATCADPDNALAVSNQWSFCVEVNLVENYCYSIPDFGWITPSECQVPGTVHVVDLVPGGTDDTGCTREFEWNRYYTFPSPQMVACVMSY